jgi:hypothetical protein
LIAAARFRDDSSAAESLGSASPEGAFQGRRRFDPMIPGSYAVCTISFDDPDSDAATYRAWSTGTIPRRRRFGGSTS